MHQNMKRGNPRPQQAIYKPGSGPLRKSDHGLDEDSTMPASSRQVKNIAAHRLSCIRQEDYNQSCADEILDSSSGRQDSNERRKNRKPEQPIYVPSVIAKARENEKKMISENEPQHNDHNLNGNNNSERGMLGRSKRYSSKRKGNDEEWRRNSPGRMSRQGSEPRVQHNNLQNSWNRARNTRSVEPQADPIKNLSQDSRCQSTCKPPSGRRHSTIGMEEKRQKPQTKLDNLPPRLRKKRLDEGKHACNNVPEEPWDGSMTITFQGTMQDYCEKPSLPSNQHLNSNNMIYNTLPNSRPRGRGRLQNELSYQMNPGFYRSMTPEKFQYQSPGNSRPGTPNFSQSNRTRSTESLHRSEIRSTGFGNFARHDDPRSGNWSTNYHRRSEDRYVDSGHIQNSRLHEREKERGRDSNFPRGEYNDRNKEKDHHDYRDQDDAVKSSERIVDNLESKLSSICLGANENSNIVNVETTGNEAFDWSEEVELHVKNLEEGMSDAMTRSSSVVSLTESVSKQPPPKSKRSSRRRRDRNRRSMSGTRERSIDNNVHKSTDYSPARNRNRKNSHNSNDAQFKAPENRNRQRGSRDRSYDKRNKSRNTSRERSFDRHNKLNSGDTDHVNWREEIRARTLEKETVRMETPVLPDDHVRRGGIIHLPKEASKPPVLMIKERPVMPEIRRSPGQKALYDPHNPNKPIIINKPNCRISSSSFSESSETATTYSTDQLGNMRPAWHNEQSDNFMHSRYPNLLKDIRRVDSEMQNYVNSQFVIQYWSHICNLRTFLKDALIYLLREDMKFAVHENIEAYFWKLLYYNFIEIMRKAIRKESENHKQYKDFQLELIDDGIEYFERVLDELQRKYNFKIENYIGVNAYSKSSGYINLALISAQKCFIYLGDLFRYKESANETTNYGKCKQLYVKAQEINSKNGRPYNQLGVIAIISRKKLDAVYYYMRSLMSKYPIPSARECLISLFDENRKKYETERKRREERLEKARLHMKEKESSNTKAKQGSLRKETWIRPDDGKLEHRTSTMQGTKTFDSDEEDLAALTSVEVNKRFVTSYLHVHGKLITKIGMETFHETALQMLKEFRALLQHSPLPLSSSRFLQLLALNMFAIESTKLKVSDAEPGLRSELQERALIVSLEMFSLILEKCVGILSEHFASWANPNILPQDVHELLPSVKIWCDWMLCHSMIWNPPPSTQDYKVGPSGDAWTRVAVLMNLLENVDQSISISHSLVAGPADGYEQVRLPEDNTLSGFTPLMCNVMQTETYAPKDVDMESAQLALRLRQLLFFGTEFLCGVDPPVLKLEYRNDAREYVSAVCTTASRSTPDTPPEFSESEVVVESFSDEESGTTQHIVLENMSNEIQELLNRKSELEERQRAQELHRQTVQKILRQSVVSVHIEVKPKNLVPDTNCFIDYLPMLKTIAASNVYTLMVPIIVLNELEGLAKGANSPERILNPMHTMKVSEASKMALDFLGGRPSGVKCITTKGTILQSTTFTMEDETIADINLTNDDRILDACMALCKGNKQEHVEGKPRKIHREVVLLTEDRNLKVKALARDVPVREVPSFLQWAGLG